MFDDEDLSHLLITSFSSSDLYSIFKGKLDAGYYQPLTSRKKERRSVFLYQAINKFGRTTYIAPEQEHWEVILQSFCFLALKLWHVLCRCTL